MIGRRSASFRYPPHRIQVQQASQDFHNKCHKFFTNQKYVWKKITASFTVDGG